MVDLTRGVVVCRRIWRREPFSNVLFYLVPYGRVSVIVVQVMEVDYEHFISPTSFAICCIASSASRITMVLHQVGNWSERLRTIIVLNSDLHSLSDGHPDLIPYQAI